MKKQIEGSADKKRYWEKLKGLTKKKSVRITSAIAVVLVVAIVVTFVALGKGNSSQAAELTVQTTEAKKGTISTTVVGTGSIASGTSTDIEVPTGIEVDEVLVKTGDTVTEGQTLATVKAASVASALLAVKESIESVESQISNLSSKANDSSTTEYLEKQVLEGKLTDLQEAQTSLTALLETKAITATCAGTIGTVNVTADTEITKAASEASSSGSSGSSGSTGSNAGSSDSSASKVSAKSDDTKAEFIQLTSTTGTTTEITTCNDLKITAPATGETPQSAITETNEYTGTIGWNCADATFQSGTAYTATIILTAKDGYEFSDKIIPELAGTTLTYQVVGVGEKNKLRIVAKYAKTASNDIGLVTKKSDSNDANASDISGGFASGSLQGDSSGGIASGATGSTGEASDSGSSESYNSYKTAAFSIASGEQAVVSINVDELDILSVKEGQTATVTLDALSGETFEGTITKIATMATTGNSSAKYAVEITLNKTEDMRLGMSASATIHVDEAKDVILIPVSALQEKGDSTFVYTSKDSDGNLSREVEVETGLSDGSQVEITSGLEEGDEVYYTKAESSSSDGEMEMSGGRGGVIRDGEKPDNMVMPDGQGAPSGKGDFGSKGE